MRILAPAKVNLFLHILGKRDDGYQDLQSLITFCDFGDYLTFEKADHFSLEVTGSFSDQCRENNLIEKAARLLEEETKQPINYCVILEKNIPVGAGLGGGSSDVARFIATLINHLGFSIEQEKLDELLLSLGADVPVCYAGKTSFVEGIGEIISPAVTNESYAALLVFPYKHISTVDIFNNIEPPYSEKLSPNKQLSTDLLSLLKRTKNDLTPIAINKEPVINDVLKALESYPDCLLSRITGSGSCCFGLFEDVKSAEKAQKFFKENYKDWWSQAVTLSL